jgi:hypothetical protein
VKYIFLFYWIDTVDVNTFTINLVKIKKNSYLYFLFVWCRHNQPMEYPPSHEDTTFSLNSKDLCIQVFKKFDLEQTQNLSYFMTRFRLIDREYSKVLVANNGQ